MSDDDIISNFLLRLSKPSIRLFRGFQFTLRERNEIEMQASHDRKMSGIS